MHNYVSVPKHVKKEKRKTVPFTDLWNGDVNVAPANQTRNCANADIEIQKTYQKFTQVDRKNVPASSTRCAETSPLKFKIDTTLLITFLIGHKIKTTN